MTGGFGGVNRQRSGRRDRGVQRVYHFRVVPPRIHVV